MSTHNIYFRGEIRKSVHLDALILSFVLKSRKYGKCPKILNTLFNTVLA